MNVIAICKSETKEMYCFHFDDSKANYSRLMNAIGRFASDPELSFTWYDAATVSQKAQRVFGQSDGH